MFPRPTSQRRLARPIVASAVVAVLATGCSTTVTTTADSSGRQDARSGTASGGGDSLGSSTASSPTTGMSAASTANVHVIGDSTSPAAKQAIATVADLQSYWGKQLPSLYGKEFEPISGGFYSVDTSTGDEGPCGDVKGNAYYCPDKDAMAWDTDLLAQKAKNFKQLAVPVIIAHEWGHAIQERVKFSGANVTFEMQADCFAGAWLRHAKDDGVLQVDDEGLNNAASAVLSVKDPVGVTQDNTEDAHGSGFDRVNAFQTGYDGGGSACKDFRDGHPIVTELPFNSPEDYENGGNEAYDSIVNGVPYDLEDFWGQVYPKIADGKAWKPVSSLKPYTEQEAPSCDGADPAEYISLYCPSQNYVGWNDDYMRTIYDKTGDFGPATMLAVQYGRAALWQEGQPLTGPGDERAACYAGSYSASVIKRDRRATSSFEMSPGDLDEAVQTLLLVGGKKGFSMVRAYRTGVMDGARKCSSLTP